LVQEDGTFLAGIIGLQGKKKKEKPKKHVARNKKK